MGFSFSLEDYKMGIELLYRKRVSCLIREDKRLLQNLEVTVNRRALAWNMEQLSSEK